MTAYRPSQVVVTYGPHIFKAFADGDFVTTETDGDTADVVKGAGGAWAILIRDAEQVATVVITVFADSADNRLLTQLYNAQRAPGVGDATILPLSVLDPNTREQEMFEQAVISKLPTRGRSVDSVPTREWTFKGVMRAVPLA